MKELAASDVNFESSSRIDEAGRVFRREGCVYRAIMPDQAAFFRGLLEQAGIQELFSKGLVSAEIAPFTLEGFGLGLSHHRVPFVSYCMEWPAEMFRAAALLTCNLSIYLLERGLTLRDAHPWNVLFDAGTPLFVDWGSICSRTAIPEWPYEQFRERFLWPLCLMAAGKSWIARRCMADVSQQLRHGDVLKLMFGRSGPALWLRTLGRSRNSWRRTWAQEPVRFLERLCDFVQKMPLRVQSTEWSDYQGPGDETLADPGRWSEKTSRIATVIQACRPATILDVGASRGWYSRFGARHGSDVVAVDVDETSVSRLYRQVSKSGDRILPLLMNIMEPTPAHGLCQGYAGATDRLRAEMVLALAITHHLVFKRGLSFDTIAAQLAIFARKYLLVEFVPSDDAHVRLWMDDRHGWYTLDNFRQALGRFFPRIEAFPSSPDPRVLLLCERDG